MSPLTLLAVDPSPGLWAGLWQILLLLGAALAAGLIAERLGQSAILGYLFAGAIVGPGALKLISEQERILHIAEVGVALLLFTIGLEFSPQRLFSLGSVALKTGPVQVPATIALAGAAALALGMSWRQAVVVGAIVAMSSTACVLRLLADRAEIDSPQGRAALGVLIVQDIAAAPLMLVTTVLAAGGGVGKIAGTLTVSVLWAILLAAAFFVVFRYLAPLLLRLLSPHRNRDLPALLAVLVALGSAWGAQAIGLSAALGAFVAGGLLAVSPFATQIRADVQPFKIVMMTLFFAAVGLLADPLWLLEHWLLVGAVCLAVIVAKAVLISSLARYFGHSWRYAVATGLVLAQIGEFSFVLATIAGTGETPLLGDTAYRTFISATILSLFATPYLTALAPRAGAQAATLAAGARLRKHDLHVGGEQTPVMSDDNESGRVLIVGFGPAGQRVAESLLDDHADRITVIDLNPASLRIASLYGLRAQAGDAQQIEVLEHAGIHNASVVVLTPPDPVTMRRLIDLVRGLAPEAAVVARSRYHIFFAEFVLAGADYVVDEEDLMGMALAKRVQETLEQQSPPLTSPDPES